MGGRFRFSAYLGFAAIVGASLAAVTPAVAAEQVVTFGFTGAVQYYEVPAGVSSVDVDACGAQGGEAIPPNVSPDLFGIGTSGLGGSATSTLTVTPGEQLAVFVGGSGESGGWNGGGEGDSASGPANGGGASDVRQGGESLADRVVVGGGGGGGGWWALSQVGGEIDGGDGGGLSGLGSYPGTQAGPGVDPAESAHNGALGLGGDGTSSPSGITPGGGGGLYGGAAGGYSGQNEVTGGSGGSGLGDNLEAGVCVGNGSVSLSYERATTPQSVTFAFTGSAQSYEVPAGVSSVDVDACGAQGEHLVGDPPAGFDAAAGEAGLGGRSLRTLAVTPGEQLAVFVGGSGAAGGWNGGGEGASDGGGASDVRQGGTGLADRVVVAGGGGGNGWWAFFPLGASIDGGAGGGISGGGSFPGDQTGPGIRPFQPELNGSLGTGGNAAADGGSGGGGGLYGGAAGAFRVQEGIESEAGSGGSGLGDSFESGVCVGNGSVTITESLPSILPRATWGDEGDSGSVTWPLQVHLSAPSTETVTVDWATMDDATGPGLAQPGSDFVAATGTVTFAPGETVAFADIEILGDTEDEPPLLWGEWGVVTFSNPTNATIDTGPFFGAGLFIIFDDD